MFYLNMIMVLKVANLKKLNLYFLQHFVSKNVKILFLTLFCITK